MKYKLVPRVNPQKRSDPPKYYAQPMYDGMVDIEFIARQIAGRSSLTTGDIMNVLRNFFEEIPVYMLLGQTVKLDNLGTFRISFTSDGAESEDAFKATAMKNPRVLFKADPDFRKRILNEIKYTIQHPGEKPAGSEDDRPVIE